MTIKIIHKRFEDFSESLTNTAVVYLNEENVKTDFVAIQNGLVHRFTLGDEGREEGHRTDRTRGVYEENVQRFKDHLKNNKGLRILSGRVVVSLK